MSWGETIFLKKVIDGKKAFRASDNIMVNYIDEKTPLSEQGITLGTFTAKTSGQIKIKALIEAPTSSSQPYTQIIVYDGTTILAIFNPPSSSYGNPTEMNQIINVEKNKTYTIKTYYATIYSPGATNCYSLDICADIIDGSLFNYTIGE